MEYSITAMGHSTFAVISSNLTITKAALFKCDECGGRALIDESGCRALFIFQLKDEYESNVNKNNQQTQIFAEKKLVSSIDGNNINDNDLYIYISSKYVLTDAGSGTFDNMKVKEIFNPTGDAWGSTYIDDEFIKILNNFTHSKHIFYNKYDE
eukprot:434876_1